MLHTSMRVCALIMGLSFTASAATAPLLTDANEHWPPASLDAPAYLSSYQDSIFHTTVTRASGTPGTAIPLVTGQTWSTRTRHTYMSQQVWSADERLLFINFGGPLLLDGETYHVIARRSVPGNHCGSWHPILPDRMLYIDETVVGWYDMRQALVLWSTTIPGYSDFDWDNAGENISVDGTMTAISAKRNADGARVTFAFNLDSRTKNRDIELASYGSEALGRISPSGRFIQIVNTNWFVDLNGAEVSNSDGVSHGDMALDEHGDDVEVGYGTVGSDDGLKVHRIRDGMQRIASPHAGSHTSGAAHQRPGWVLCSTIDPLPSRWAQKPHTAEIWAVRLSDGAIERWCHTHMEDPVGYWSQPQAVPSPRGDRACFATNWGMNGAENACTLICDTRPLRSDRIAPPTPAAPQASSVNSPAPTISGTVEAGAIVRIYDNGIQIGTVTAEGTGHWSWIVSPPLTGGSHRLTVTATDESGNTSAASEATVITVANSSHGGGRPTVHGGSNGSRGCGIGASTAFLLCGWLLFRPTRRKEITQ